jgi:hypothetical protein
VEILVEVLPSWVALALVVETAFAVLVAQTWGATWEAYFAKPGELAVWQ